MMRSRHAKTLRTIPFLIATCLIGLPASAKYSGGTGEPNDPYQIATAADLIALGETPEDYDKHFLLTADIDLDPNLPGRKVFDKAVIAPDVNETNESWELDDNPFTGVFEGNGHTISHLTIIGKGCLGLFGQLGHRADVRNLGVVDVNVVGAGSRVGGLVGWNYAGSISASYSSGTVSGTDGVGGLVGENWGSIAASHSSGSISGTKWAVGGLVGGNYGSIVSSYSSGAISGEANVGGLAGWNDGSVAASYSSGWVSGTERVGGLTGRNGGSIAMSCSSGSVSGTEWIGGLVGDNGWGGNIATSYSSGSVSGTEYVGGLVGATDGSIAASYSSGSVSGTELIGGLVGCNWGSKGSIVTSFWDIQTSGQGESAGGTGKTTAEMRDPSTFRAAGWDFVGQPDGPHDIWAEPESGGYPILWWQLSPLPELPNFSGGTGESTDPYLISTAEDLNSIGHNPRLMKCHFKLLKNLDFAGLHFYSIGDRYSPYVGVFDGNDHTVSHLTTNVGSHLGFFAWLEGGVENLGVVDVNIVGSSGWVGGLANYSSGSITNCYVSGSVSATGSLVGGLVGWNNGSIITSYSNGSVSGTAWIGGLVGDNEGIIAASYSTSSVRGTDFYVGGLVGLNAGGITSSYCSSLVSGDRHVGGLVGRNSGTIAASYSSGSVTGQGSVGGLVGSSGDGSIATSYSSASVSGTGDYVGGLVGSNSEGDTISSSFWDIQTSGQTTSAGGTGLTTAEMQTAATFLDTGWDFVGEVVNGADDIWWILEGRDYPRLLWKLPESLPLQPVPAFSPDPHDGAADTVQSLVLTWRGGTTATGHDVYFGEDEDVVANATSDVEDIYRGRQMLEVSTYNPGPLERRKTYYWRIDEVNEADPNSPWKGTVWSFTTADYRVVTIVDDFESYTDDIEAGQAIFQTWLDGMGFTGYGGNGTGSLVGNWDAPFAEQHIVHGGRQSTPMDYDNWNAAWYSEADRTWESPQDWTSGGADMLTLYFRGEQDNSPEPLYVGIEDSDGWMAVVVHPDPNAVLVTDWQKWHIPFVDLQAAGVDVAAVQKMVIGVGDREKPKPGGTGRIYIDDIRLTKRMP